MMQEMEEEDMEIEHVFVAHEIDLDYEFDAARFFDFTRQETPAEARQAELWFQTARSYPPSRPYISFLFLTVYLNPLYFHFQIIVLNHTDLPR